MHKSSLCYTIDLCVNMCFLDDAPAKDKNTSWFLGWYYNPVLKKLNIEDIVDN